MQSFGSGNTNYLNEANTNIIIVNNTRTEDEDNQIKQWLSPLEPRKRHQDVQTNRVDGVGRWLLEMNEFREWYDSQGVPKQDVLLCYGDPGVGKTHISSLVIDWLCDQTRNGDIAVAGLYCDYLTQEEQTPTNILGAILKELLERDEIPGHVREAFRKEKGGFGGRAVRLPDLLKILKTTIASLPEVFICIDGLDECRPNNRFRLLKSLRDIVQASPTTRLFLSGRPHILDEIKGFFTLAIMIPVVPTAGDIERYMTMRLDSDTLPDAMDGDLRAKIMRVIPETSSKIFLLVSLNIDAVLEETTIYRRKKRLDEMIRGNGLRDAYAATLARIRAQSGSRLRLGMEVLMWLSHSERPLNADELCHALGVEIGSTDLKPENIPAIETLLGCSLGLVIVEAPSYTVRLVHYTLREYLSDNIDLFHSPHSMIAEVCLTYLNFQCVRDHSPIPAQSTPGTPLLEYASCYWGTHARRDMTESVNSLALRLLDEFDKHVSSGVLFSHTYPNWDRGLKQGNPLGFTGLHCAAYFGIHEIVVALLEMGGRGLNATDEVGSTAISWAARDGHRDIVRTLLEPEDITPDTTDNWGRTPLLWAAGYGHEDIVKMLLERRDVTPTTTDNWGRTPLSWAARDGHWNVVKMLLEREEVAPETADNWGRTLLSRAADRGHGDVVQMLLKRKDVTPDTADKYGQTPLSFAMERGHIRIVEMLQERCRLNQDMVRTDLPGPTSLTPTSKTRRGRIARWLLGHWDSVP